MRRKNNPILGLEITAMGSEGAGLGRIDEKVIFVERTVPGDVVNVLPKRKRKGFTQAVIQQMVKPSSLRVKPFCEHFELCGGCKWQYLEYQQQLIYKEENVYSALERIGKQKGFQKLPIIPSPTDRFYRNKLEFTFTANRWLTADEIASGEDFGDRRALGFHVPGGYDRVINIDKCHLLDDFHNEIRNTVGKFALEQNMTFYNIRAHTGYLRNLIIRSNSKNHWMVIMVFGEDHIPKFDQFLNSLIAALPAVNSWYYIANTKMNDSIADQLPIHFYGDEFLLEEFHATKFRIGPKSFFQTNTAQALRLYNLIKEWADVQTGNLVYDLYCGIGSIGLFVADPTVTLVGIEFVEEAIQDAQTNAKINGFNKCHFFAGDIKEVIPNITGEFPNPDVVIVDPPRSGMHEEVIMAINKLETPRLIYVSCNAATQARDLELLSETYELIKSQPVDMFPQTTHVENVALLQAR